MRLLDELRQFLQREHALATDRNGAPADVEVQAATALLLLEAAHGDEAYVWREHRAILQGLKRAFGLGKAEVEALLERAEVIRPPVVRLADITQVILDRYDPAQRREVARLVWEIVDADGFVGEWEHVFASHVALALSITERDANSAHRGARSSSP